MAGPPTFFFSHARQDREKSRNNYLERFFDDLQARLASLEGIDLEKGPIGVIDRETSQGEDFDRRLGKALSSNKAFISIFTPLYFKRENCGKELFVFLMRSKGIGIDGNGALTGIENVIPVRWEIKEAYYSNTEANSVIPPFLRLLNDRPSDPGNDPARSAAIKFYYDKGMQNCVASEPHYTELLNSIALRIRALSDLPETSGLSFTTTQNAFVYNWSKHFAEKGATATPVPAAAPSQPIVPRPLLSVVAFYVTRRDFEIEPGPVDFADQLIAEPMGSGTTSTAPEFAQLLTDVRGAGILQSLHVFHAAAHQKAPTDPAPLLDRLKSLTAARILALLIVDSDVWPGNGGASASAIEEIARSPEWTGLVLIAPVGGFDMEIDNLANQRGLPARFVLLPRTSDERVPVLRRALVHVRGRVLSGSGETLPGAERVPLLKGVVPNNKPMAEDR